MNERLSSSIKNPIPSIFGSMSSSRSLIDLSHTAESIGSSEASSTDEVSHSGAVTKLRTETCVTLRDVGDSESPLLNTRLDLDNATIATVEDAQVIIEQLETIQFRYSEQFKDKETHIFILSQSGKPIYSRYGSDSQIVALTGLMQALVSFVGTDDDSLKIMTAGNNNFVFLIREHMILVAVSKSSFVPSQLRIVLNYLYHQILSLLTYSSISKSFKKRPGLDLRRLLVGTDRFLTGLLEFMEQDMGPLLNAVLCVPMHATFRQSLLNTISQAIKMNIKSLINDLVFAILLLDEKLVGIVRRKDHQPHPMDLHLVLNLIRNSTYFKTQICWLPLCLPKFDADCFFYAHISYLCPRLSLVLLTVNPDHFDVLQQCQSTICHSMKSSGLFDKLNEIYTVEEFLKSFKLTELRHFIYKMRTANQYISYSDKNPEEDKKIMCQYLRLHHFIHTTDRPARLVYQCTDSETLIAWQATNFELYATLNQVTNKRKVLEVLNKLLEGINKQKNRLFITISPTF